MRDRGSVQITRSGHRTNPSPAPSVSKPSVQKPDTRGPQRDEVPDRVVPNLNDDRNSSGDVSSKPTTRAPLTRVDRSAAESRTRIGSRDQASSSESPNAVDGVNATKGPLQKPSMSRKPAGSGGLQTIEKSPIKPAKFNGGVNQAPSKGNFKDPAFSGPFKGAYKAPACGHLACGGHSHCSFSSHFHHRVSYISYSSFYGPYCNTWSGSGFSFFYGSGNFSVGLSYSDYWPSYSCSWPSYWYHNPCWKPCAPRYWCGWSGWGCHCSTFYCVHRCYRPVVYTYYYYPSTYYVPVYSDPVYYSSAQTYTPAPAPYEKQEPVAETADAWDLLNSGNPREARRVFAREIDLHPNDGLPQIGYAIASTLIERKIEAIAMMRRALKNDPEAIHEVPQADGVLKAIEDALDEYIEMSDRRADNVDAQFMIAAMRYMLGDVSHAFYAVDRAMDWGDRHDSAANLHAIIRKAMEQPQQPAPQPQPATPAQPAYAPLMMDVAPPQPPTIVPDDQPWEVPF